MFYASCFGSGRNLIGKKSLRLDWEQAVYRPLFALADTLTKPIFVYRGDNAADEFINAILKE